MSKERPYRHAVGAQPSRSCARDFERVDSKGWNYIGGVSRGDKRIRFMSRRERWPLLVVRPERGISDIERKDIIFVDGIPLFVSKL